MGGKYVLSERVGRVGGGVAGGVYLVVDGVVYVTCGGVYLVVGNVYTGEGVVGEGGV